MSIETVTSDDGTAIAYERHGAGPVLILVEGALGHRNGPLSSLAPRLERDLTVVTYDRRGRGASGDTPPYDPDREIDDLRALIGAVGGSAFLYGLSSGGALVLRALAAGLDVPRAAVYEVPYTAEIEPRGVPGYTERLGRLLADGDRGGAVELFMTLVGLPAELIAGMRGAPMWPALEAVAPTLAYDDLLLTNSRIPHEVLDRIRRRVLVLTGDAGPQALQEAAKLTAAALPDGELRVLPGQTHDADPDAVAPVLRKHLLG